MRCVMIVAWLSAALWVVTTDAAPVPSTAHLDRWKPDKSEMDKIKAAVRKHLSKRHETFDELAWHGPYRWREKIHVIWMTYKYVETRGGTSRVEKRFSAFRFNVSRGITRVSIVEEAKPSEFNDESLREIRVIVEREKAESKLSGKRIDRPQKSKRPRAAARTWTDATGKFSVEAELLDYRKGMVTLLTKDERAIRLKLSKLSKADQRYVAARKK